MGMSLSDFSKTEKNLQGKNGKPDTPKEKKIINTKGKFCHGCGFKIKSAIVRSILFSGNFCNDCIKDMPEWGNNMNKKTREGKKQQSFGKKKSESFSIFDTKSPQVKREKRQFNKKSDPLISKEQRNQILRNLHNGISGEIQWVLIKVPPPPKMSKECWHI